MKDIGINLNNWFTAGSITLFLLMISLTNNPIAKYIQLNLVTLSYASLKTIVISIILSVIFLGLLVLTLYKSKIIKVYHIFKVPNRWTILGMLGSIILVTLALFSLFWFMYELSMNEDINSFARQISHDNMWVAFWQYTAFRTIKTLGVQLILISVWLFINQIMDTRWQKDTRLLRCLTSVILMVGLFILVRISTNTFAALELVLIHSFAIFNFQGHKNYWTSSVIVIWAEFIALFFVLLPAMY